MTSSLKHTLSSLLLCLHIPPMIKSIFVEHIAYKMLHTWKIRPSGEYVDADRSYPVPIEVMVVEFKLVL